MLLKGIFLILTGISGLIITTIFIIKSLNKSNKKKSNYSSNILEDSHYTTKQSNITTDNEVIFPNNIKPLNLYNQMEKSESTVLLDDFVMEKKTEDTILLEEKK